MTYEEIIKIIEDLDNGGWGDRYRKGEWLTDCVHENSYISDRCKEIAKPLGFIEKMLEIDDSDSMGYGRVRVIYKFSDHDIHIQFSGSLESHGGSNVDEIIQVFPKTKMITVYE